MILSACCHAPANVCVRPLVTPDVSQAANLRDTTAFEELEEADTFESVLDVIEARDEVWRRDASSNTAVAQGSTMPSQSRLRICRACPWPSAAHSRAFTLAVHASAPLQLIAMLAPLLCMPLLPRSS